MRRVAAALVLAAAAALLAAGCATSGTGSGSGAGSSSGSGSAGAPPPATTTTAPAPTSAAPPTDGPTVTVDGVVERGVEPGCLVLRAGSESYLLEGPQASKAPVAVPIRVSGEILLNVASYCQQGTPLQVSTITRR
jgi:hypothetical protein